MKIEPIRHAKTPKYLAALAVAVSAAGLLTGCRTAGDVVVTEGDAPIPAESETEQVELAGDAAVTEPDCTDSTCPEDAS